MFRSLQARLWLSYVALSAVLLVIMATGLLIYLLANPAPVRQATLRLEAALSLIVQAERLTNISGPARMAMLAERTDQNFDARILFLDNTGAPLFDSRPAAARARKSPSATAR